MPKTGSLPPVHQGDIDVFCAAYAVINAVRKIHGTRLLICRDLLRDALMEIASDTDCFWYILTQQISHEIWLDKSLQMCARRGLIDFVVPFPSNAGKKADAGPTMDAGADEDAETDAGIPAGPDDLDNLDYLKYLDEQTGQEFDARQHPEDAISPAELWTTLENWFMVNPQRAAVFHFVRWLLPDAKGSWSIIEHWTCAGELRDNRLFLYDSAQGNFVLQSIAREDIVCSVQHGEAAHNKVFIVPHTVRLIRSRTEAGMRAKSTKKQQTQQVGKQIPGSKQ